MAFEISITWDANTEPDLAGYRIYVSKVSGQYDRGNMRKEIPLQGEIDPGIHIITVPDDGIKRYSVVTAFDVDDNESGYSNEIEFTPPDAVAPGNPQNYRVSE